MKDETLKRSWVDWTMNTLKKADMPDLWTVDMMHFLTKIGCKKYIVCGAGASLRLIDDIYEVGDLLVANQSSLYWLVDHGYDPHLVVLSDGSKAASEKLKEAIMNVHWNGDIIAGYHCPSTSDMYMYAYYIAMLIAGPEKEASAFNAVTQLVSKNGPFIAQAGNVVNASILVLNVLMELKLLKVKPIVVVGLDLSFGKMEETLYEHIDEKIDADRISTIKKKEGEWIDDKFEMYEESLKAVVQGATHKPYLYNPGSRLLKIVEEWVI